jgi:hypothetical protein
MLKGERSGDLRTSSWTATSPETLDANSPSRDRASEVDGDAPPQLGSAPLRQTAPPREIERPRRTATLPRSLAPLCYAKLLPLASSSPRGGRQRPPAAWLRCAKLLPLPSPSVHMDGDVLSTRPGVRAGDSGRPDGRPPFLRRAHPISRPPSHLDFPHPRAPHRASPYRGFPPPSGPGAARPWLRRGRRKRRAGIPVMAHYLEPRPARHSPPPGCAFT